MNKNLLSILIVLLILSVSGYYIYKHGVEMGLAKPALLLKVSINETEIGAPKINNVEIEPSSVVFFYKRTDSIVDFPEIDVNARANRLDSEPISYWASTKYDRDGVYELKLMFRDGREPKKGDVLLMPIRVVGHRGVILFKTTAFYCWDCEE
jgi:hypothetical protein